MAVKIGGALSEISHLTEGGGLKFCDVIFNITEGG